MRDKEKEKEKGMRDREWDRENEILREWEIGEHEK